MTFSTNMSKTCLLFSVLLDGSMVGDGVLESTVLLDGSMVGDGVLESTVLLDGSMVGDGVLADVPTVLL